MEKSDAVDALAALAQDTRLDIFRTLVEYQPAGLPARNLDGALATAATGSSSAVCAMWQSTARETLRIRADA